MKLLSSVAVILGLILLLPASAEARKISAADRVLVKKAMVYLDAMAAIMEKGVEKPNKALDKLDAYLKRHGAALRKLGEKLDAVEKKLDADEKTKWQKYVEELPPMKRFLAAMMAFMQKHSDNQAIVDRFVKILGQLTPEKKPEAEKKSKPKPKKKSKKSEK